jgi:hypothetical protein
MVTETREVWRLPHPSQECEKGPEARLIEGRLTIRYDFENEAGNYDWADFNFVAVVAFKFLGEELCGEDQFAALDRLVEVKNSEWARNAHETDKFTGDQLHHYRVYFDDYGCFEVLSARFTPDNNGAR